MTQLTNRNHLVLNKSIWILSFFAFLFFNCKTQNDLKVAAPPVDNILSKALLWEISGKGLKQPSFLYGTIHIIDSKDFFFPAGTLGAFDQSSKVFFEINMAEMNDMSKLMPLLQKAFMTDGLTLKDLIPEHEYKLVKDHFDKLGLPIFFLEKIKPLFLTAFASGDINPGDLQSGKIKSYEMEFSEMATDSGKETGGLETVEFQLSLFDSIPYVEQAKMLVESIKSNDTENDEFKNIVKIYKNQDIEGMHSMMQEDDGIRAYEDILLSKRNRSWIPTITSEIMEKTCFIAVGAGHLGGPNGVIKLLRKEGYTVLPLSAVHSE